MAEINRDNLYRPATEADVIELVRHAHANYRKIRICGSGHSVLQAIVTDGFDAESSTTSDPNVLNVGLERLNSVNFERMIDPSNPRGGLVEVARVGGGLFIGPDPLGPDVATERPNLIAYLRARRKALCVVGGITHQSVAGFMSTGSAGASILHSFGDSVLALRLVDGTGAVLILQRSPATASPAEIQANPFYWVGVSMGLLGVITEVTLRIEDEFDIEGTFSTCDVESFEYDLLGTDSTKQPIADFFRKNTYARLLWWPQQGVNRVQTWRCERVQSGGELNPHVQFEHPALEQSLIGTLYQRVLPFVKDGDWEQAQAGLELLKGQLGEVLAGMAAAAVAAVTSLVLPTAGPSQEQLARALAELEGLVAEASTNKLPPEPIYARMLGGIIGLFLGTDTSETPFNDSWWHGIPDDNQISDKLVPVCFTEVWVPLNRATDVMRAIGELYRTELGPIARGSFCIEIYAGPKSDFPMSAAYGTDVLRIDVFALEGGPESADLDAFYKPLWEKLAQFDGRFHWGKRLAPPSSEAGLDYLRRVMGEKLTEFLETRDEFDPNGVFLTNYWSRHLGIAARGAESGVWSQSKAAE